MPEYYLIYNLIYIYESNIVTISVKVYSRLRNSSVHYYKVPKFCFMLLKYFFIESLINIDYL